MADFQHHLFNKRASATLSKKPISNGNAYDDIFGGPPKFSAPSFAARIEDYGEIFSNFYSHKTPCSIPILDFPESAENELSMDARNPNFDYSEVFGGFDVGDFAISYDKIFPASKGAEKPSGNTRISAQKDSHQQSPAVVHRVLSKESDIDSLACSEENCSLSNGMPHHYDDAKQFNVSYNKTNQGGKDDSITGITHIAQLHEVSGFTYVVDACSPSQMTGCEKRLPQKTGGLSLNVDSNGAVAEGNHYRETLLHAPVCSNVIKASESDLKADKNQLESNASAAVTNHLHNSGHLKLSGDKSHPGKVFLTVSEINLQTQPCQVPPPSRPPPKLVAKQVDSKRMMGATMKAYPDEAPYCNAPTNDRAYLLRTVSETHALKDAVKESSLPCFDVEVDASSAAAASAAAMKEAMEKAEARIKSAKLLMERKRDNFQSRMKLGLNENRRGKERKEVKITQEDNTMKEVKEIFERENGEKDNFTGVQRHKNLKAANIGPDEGYIEIAKETIDKWQRKECGVTSESHKQEEGAGEWKAEKQFYELVKDDHFKVAKELPAKANEGNLIQKKPSGGIIGVEKKEKSRALKEVCELEENDRKVKVATVDVQWEENERKLNTAREQEENVKKIKAAKKACEWEENEIKLNEAEEAREWDENEKKLQAAREAREQEENEKRVKAAREACEQEESEKRLKAAQEACEQEENEERLKVAQEAAEREVSEKKLKEAREAREWEENEKRIKRAREENEKRKKVAREAHEREENEKRLKAAQEAREWEENYNKLKAAQEALEQEENEKRLKAEREAREREETENRMKAAQMAREQEENEKKLKAAQEAWEREENEKKLKAAQEAHEKEENEKKLKAAQEENEKKLKAEQEAWVREENEKKLKAAQEAREKEENEKKLKAAQEACEQEKHEKKLKTAEAYERENEKLKASQKAHEGEEENKKLNADKEAHVHENNVKKAAQEDHELEDQKKPKDTCEHEHEKKSQATEEAQEYEHHKTLESEQEESKKNFKAPQEACVQEENEKNKAEKKLKVVKEAFEQGEKEKKLKASQDTCELEENNKKLKGGAQEASKPEENEKKLTSTEAVLTEDKTEKKPKTVQEAYKQEEKIEKMKVVQEVHLQDINKETLREAKEAIGCELNDTKTRASIKQTHERGQNEMREGDPALDRDESKNQSKTTQAVFQWLETVKKLKAAQQAIKVEEKENVARTAPVVSLSQGTEEKDKDRVLELERARKIEEEREREREREKDRIAFERANREARDRTLVEARERAERIAVERATAESRQRAMVEARERAEKASAEARERSLAEKASMEARLRVERAAVERATAEARQRAVERAMAERAALEARERAERSSSKEDGGMRQSSLFSDVRDFAHDSQIRADGESAKRCKARLERHLRTVERAARALAEKNTRDVLAQREQAERHRLAETLDADVRRWSNGKEGNLRALLSTLQYILGPESAWQPIPLTDVITAVAVKKAYRKATLCVHPDKVQQRGSSIQQKYICEKVFDLLKEAWNKFNSEER